MINYGFKGKLKVMPLSDCGPETVRRIEAHYPDAKYLVVGGSWEWIYAYCTTEGEAFDAKRALDGLAERNPARKGEA